MTTDQQQTTTAAPEDERVAQVDGDEATFRDQVFASTRELDRLESVYEQRKAEADLARKALESARRAHFELLRSWRDGPGPLFAYPQEEVDEENWRAWPLVEVLGEKLAEKVRAGAEPARVTMLGELVAWTDREPLTQMRGVGEAVAATIEEKLDEFWEQNPELAEDANR